MGWGMALENYVTISLHETFVGGMELEFGDLGFAVRLAADRLTKSIQMKNVEKRKSFFSFYKLPSACVIHIL